MGDVCKVWWSTPYFSCKRRGLFSVSSEGAIHLLQFKSYHIVHISWKYNERYYQQWNIIREERGHEALCHVGAPWLKRDKFSIITYNGSKKRFTWITRLMGKVLGYIWILKGTGFDKYWEIYQSVSYAPVSGGGWLASGETGTLSKRRERIEGGRGGFEHILSLNSWLSNY